jgi:hypothetical protein
MCVVVRKARMLNASRERFLLSAPHLPPLRGESVGVLWTPFLVLRTPMRSIGYGSEATEGEGAFPRF